jgi:hypothetical protein
MWLSLLSLERKCLVTFFKCSFSFYLASFVNNLSSFFSHDYASKLLLAILPSASPKASHGFKRKASTSKAKKNDAKKQKK